MGRDGKLAKVNKKEATDKEAGIFVMKQRSYTNISLKSLRSITMTIKANNKFRNNMVMQKVQEVANI